MRVGSPRQINGAGIKFVKQSSLGSSTTEVIGPSQTLGFVSSSFTESASSSDALTTSNIGFKLLKKSGWKEGSGLGISEQGRVEPVEVFVKHNKRGLGAEQPRTGRVLEQESGSSRRSPESHVEGKRSKRKKSCKKFRKTMEEEKRAEERMFERAFFMEFWPDNV